MTSFGTIRNNTALKRGDMIIDIKIGFGTIRNNTALKRRSFRCTVDVSFGTIRNNTALKLLMRFVVVKLFCNTFG